MTDKNFIEPNMVYYILEKIIDFIGNEVLAYFKSGQLSKLQDILKI